MTNPSWLAGLKAGDRVIVECKGKPLGVETIEHTSPIIVRTKDGWIYCRETGLMRNSAGLWRIAPFTEAAHRLLCGEPDNQQEKSSE